MVVLPCVPAMAMPCFKRISSASMRARGTTGMRRERAAITSGLSSRTAVDTTTASAPSTFAGRCSVLSRTPSDESLWVAELTARSEPLTW